ncbi:hypothetical protein AB0K00_25445 [Dactylosporangium sp. NPDC049525]|uniref:hypothetical protein n=1 Tax=Dactylosporangium sp. NPDC049525 TaxID=3154730 RepID=UPI00343C53ED
MKTTITIESSDSQVPSTRPDQSPAAGDATDAGPAPGAGGGQGIGAAPALPGTDHNGGEPADWLIDAITAAGVGAVPPTSGQVADGIAVHDAGAGPSA